MDLYQGGGTRGGIYRGADVHQASPSTTFDFVPTFFVVPTSSVPLLYKLCPSLAQSQDSAEGGLNLSFTVDLQKHTLPVKLNTMLLLATWDN